MELGPICCEPRPYKEWFTRFASECCYSTARERFGCTDQCYHADWFSGYMWHGPAGDTPTPESVHPNNEPRIKWICPVCLAEWVNRSRDYVARVHAMMRGELLPAEFDEEAERARLVAVER